MFFVIAAVLCMMPWPVFAEKQAQSISAKDRYAVSVGWARNIHAKAKTPLTYRSLDRSILTVSPDGVITGHKLGKTKVIIHAAADKYYRAQSKTVTVRVYDAVRNKRVLIEGDSIQTNCGQFIKQSCSLMGAKSVRITAVRGASLGYNPDSRKGRNSVYYRISNMTKEQLSQYQYIFISAGTNDWNNMKTDIGLGDVDSTDERTIAGALNLMLTKIRNEAPKAKIVVVTPLHRYLYIDVTTGNRYKRNCDMQMNLQGYTLEDCRRIMREVAGKYDNTYVIDGKTISKSHEMNSLKYTKDYVHPMPWYGKRVLSERFKHRLNTIFE